MNGNTIAVLPFVNMSSDPENEYFSDGITEEIINALAKIEHLKVISRTSSFFFKNKDMPLSEIAAQLKVAIILEGSVRVAHGMVRITAQLIQAAEDFHFWSESWDRKLENIFEVQDEISLLIAEKIREQFGHFEIVDHLVKKQTENLDAYAFSLKARYHFNKWNPQDVQTAINFYEQAVALDPNHTESYVGLADAYGFMATTEFMPREEAWAKAVMYTHQAYEQDPENAGVHYQLANLSFFTDCNFGEAAQHTFKALALKPNYPEAQQYMAFLYMLCGKMENALHHLQLALAIDPLNQETLFYQAYYAYRSAEFEKARLQLDDLLAKNPKNLPALIVKAYCLLMLQRYDEVLSMMEKLPQEIVMPDEKLGITCLTYIMQGSQSNAQKYFAQLKEGASNTTSLQAHSYLFLAYVWLNQYDEAFAWLEEALTKKSSIFLLSYSDPLSHGLKQDDRYLVFHNKLYPTIGPEDLRSVKKAPLLDEETVNTYTRKLMNFVEQESPFLNPNLSLRLLAEQVEIHPNQLSWLINEQLGKNFNEFINRYRIEHFKKLAVDPSNNHISLIGLAYESGFNSKTVFNTFFKKEMGVTPSEFIKNHS
uniref:Helix-turn-helix domain-containing protein n=1 Tax=Roseihalotalea indica TaxID=2867963 RepID=A0AA49JCF1_9BACT|nr:helix-turn-helix domain-containing protein [Tunicatimonas sp. TK19036]